MKLTHIKINKKWFARDFPRRLLEKSHHGTGRVSLLGSDKLEKLIATSQWTSFPAPSKEGPLVGKNRLGFFVWEL